MGNGEWGMGNGEWGMGERPLPFSIPDFLFTPHPSLITHHLLFRAAPGNRSEFGSEMAIILRR
jgi:hypothetical protein